jgi:hypothetical protein
VQPVLPYALEIAAMLTPDQLQPLDQPLVLTLAEDTTLIGWQPLPVVAARLQPLELIQQPTEI